MNNNEISIPLWKTKSEKGKEYYRGTKTGIEINGKVYKTTLFTNENKKTDKSPDMTIKLSELIQDNIQVPQNVKTNYEDGDIELTDEDIDETFNNNLELPF